MEAIHKFPSHPDHQLSEMDVYYFTDVYVIIIIIIIIAMTLL